MKNDTRLGRLINPSQQQVEIYRLQQKAEVLHLLDKSSGEDVVSGFTFDLQLI